MNVTFQDLLNAAGAVVAAGIITTLVQLIKAVLPTLDARISGALMAFVLSAILYVLAAIAVGVSDLNGGLNVFLAWLACATGAVGIKSTVDHVNSQRSAGS